MSGQSMTRRCDWSELSPSVAVVETVADLDDTAVGALPPLGYAVDMDALDELLRGTVTADPEGVVVSFRYHGYDVSVSSSGWLEVDR